LNVLSLVLCLLVSNAALADGSAPAATAGSRLALVAASPSGDAAGAPAASTDGGHGRTGRKVGIGLLIGSAAAAAVAITFVALAKVSNDQAVSSGVFDPSAESRRNAFEVAHAVMFTISGAALVPGLVFLLE
jgi:hypothetical protein